MPPRNGRSHRSDRLDSEHHQRLARYHTERRPPYRRATSMPGAAADQIYTGASGNENVIAGFCPRFLANLTVHPIYHDCFENPLLVTQLP
jgi:hypothetical protein